MSNSTISFINPKFNEEFLGLFGYYYYYYYCSYYYHYYYCSWEKKLNAYFIIEFNSKIKMKSSVSHENSVAHITETNFRTFWNTNSYDPFNLVVLSTFRIARYFAISNHRATRYELVVCKVAVVIGGSEILYHSR